MSRNSNNLANIFSISANEISLFRKKLNLSVIAFAQMLEVEPSTIEAWEAPSAVRRCPYPFSEVKRVVTHYLKENGAPPNSPNRLFGHFHMTVARTMAGLSVDEFAQSFGCSSAIWKKYESDRRFLPDQLKKRLERVIERNFECVDKVTSGTMR